MLLYLLPIVIVICSNTLYHIFAKSMPDTVNPMASLFVTYLVAAGVTFLLMIVNQGLTKQELIPLRSVHWTSFALGVCVIGLEFGYIMAYRAGWNISVGSLAANIILAVLLLIAGVLLFHEHLSVNKLIGIALCIAGLIFINRN